MNQRKRLTDILVSANGGNNLGDLWNNIQAADDFGPLPAGEYVARIESGELENSRTNGTPGYKLTFVVHEGDHVGRRLWHDIWLSVAALPMAKRDLGKIGVTSLGQLESPLPQGIVCRVRLLLLTDNSSKQFNKVKSFDVLRIETPEADPYAPTDDPEGGKS